MIFFSNKRSNVDNLTGYCWHADYLMSNGSNHRGAWNRNQAVLREGFYPKV